MSLRARLLNAWLRRVERPALARIPSDPPSGVRRRFERNMRLIYGRPKGARERVIAGCRALEVGPQNDAPALLFFHGGAYAFGSPEAYLGMCKRLARACGRRVIIPDYPLAPENPFPAAPQAALDIYKALRSEGPIAIAGDSAGGGLALSLLGMICAGGLDQPERCIALSPFTDLTLSGESLTKNARDEVVLVPERIGEARDLYLVGVDPTDPRASPLFADFSGACPVHIWVGSTEILLDDAVRMAETLRAQGVPTTLEVAEDLPHVWPLFADWQLPESTATMEQIGGLFQTSAASARR